MQNKPVTKKYSELNVNEKFSFDVSITKEIIDNFAELSGDRNPLHMDDDYSKTTIFGQRIGHGMLSGLWFSRLIGMHLPGTYSLYLSQSLNFHKPFKIGLKLKVTGEIIQKIDAVQTVKIKTTITDEFSKETFVSGDALVKLLS